MSDVSNDSVEIIMDTTENELYCGSESEENRSDSEDFSAKSGIEADYAKYMKVDFSRNEDVCSVASKVSEGPEIVNPRSDNRNIFDHNNATSNEKQTDFIEDQASYLDAEINNSRKQTINAHCNSEKASFILNKSECIILNNFSEKDIEFDNEKTKPHGDLLNLEVDLSLNEIIQSVESEISEGPKSGDPPSYDNFDKSGFKHLAVSLDEEQEDIKPLDTEKNNSCKTIGAFCNSEKDIILNKNKYNISNYVSEKNIIEDHEKVKPDTYEIAHEDILNFEFDLSLDRNVHSVESKVDQGTECEDLPTDTKNKLNTSEVNHTVVCTDEKQANFFKVLDAEINNPCKLTVDTYHNSEKGHFILNKSELKFSDDFSAKNIMESDHEKTKVDTCEFISKEDKDLLNEVDLSQNELIDSVESKVCEGPETVDLHKANNNNLDSFMDNHNAVSTDVKRKNFTKTLYTDLNDIIKQIRDEYGLSEKNNLYSDNVNINLEGISIKDHARFDKDPDAEPEMQHHQNKSNISSESNCIINANRDVCEANQEISPCLDTISENLNVTVRENDDSVADGGESKTICQALNILRTKIQKSQIKVAERKKPFEIITLESEIKAVPDNSNVISLSDNERNRDYEIMFSENATDSNKEKETLEKFREELDNELEIFKAEFLDIKRKLDDSTNEFTLEDVYSFFKKIDDELTNFKESLKEQRTRFRSKCLYATSKTLNKQVKPFYSNQQYPQKTGEASLDKYRFESKNCSMVKEKTRSLYEKVESHHSYDNYCQRSPQKTIKTRDTYRPKPKYFSCYEKKTCKKIYRTKRESSPYNYNHHFQRSPKKRLRTCSKKCCPPENGTSYGKRTIGNRSEEESENDSYSSELAYYTKMRGISKYSIAHKKFSKSNAKSYTGHSIPISRSPNSGEKYKKSLSRTCSRNKIGESRYKKEYKLPKYSSEDDFTSDSKDSFQSSSSFSLSELSSIDSDYYDHTKYLNSTPDNAISVEKNNVSSRKNRSRKRTKSQYERERLSASGSASDSSNSVQEISFGKKHDREKAYKKKNTEKKRLNSLINRQMDLINDIFILRKKDDELVPVQNSSSTSNYPKKSGLSKENFKGKIIALEEKTSEENLKKRKNRGFEQDTPPCKVAKTRNYPDPISKYKRSTENYRPELQSNIGLSSPPSPISPVERKRRKKGKETSYSSTQTSRSYMREKNETKFRNFDNKCNDETCSDVIQENSNENDEECLDVNELNNVKDIKSYIMFLSKKKDKHTNAELLLKEPVAINLFVNTSPKSTHIVEDSYSVRIPQRTEDSFDYRKSENAPIQKNQKITESNSVFSEKVSRKVRETTRVAQAASEKKKQSSTKKKAAKMPEEDKKSFSTRDKHAKTKKPAENISYEKHSAPKPKYRFEGYLDDSEAENASIRKIQKITRNNSENVTRKLKETTCVPQATSKKKKQSSVEKKTVTKMPAEGKRDVSSSLQLFMKLNQEIGKKVTKGCKEHK